MKLFLQDVRLRLILEKRRKGDGGKERKFMRIKAALGEERYEDVREESGSWTSGMRLRQVWRFGGSVILRA